VKEEGSKLLKDHEDREEDRKEDREEDMEVGVPKRQKHAKKL
jgi:hypothetical protein